MSARPKLFDKLYEVFDTDNYILQYTWLKLRKLVQV